MKYIKIIFSIFMSMLFFSGCASIREYPRCYLFKSPNNEEVDIANRDAEKLIAQALVIQEYSIGKDQIAVNTSKYQHNKLEEVWPAYGCVNLRRPFPETGEINDKWIVFRCQGFLGELLIRNSQVSRTAIADKYKEFICH